MSFEKTVSATKGLVDTLSCLDNYACPNESMKVDMSDSVADESNELQTPADEWHTLSADERAAAFKELPYSEKDDFFLSLSARDQSELVLSLPSGERRIWMRLLPPDDATDVIQETPEEHRPALIGLLDDYTRREVHALLAYAEDEAGGLMSPRFARLRPDMTVDEAVAYLRRQAEQVETIHYAYVLDSDQRLLGIVPLRRLMSAPRDQSVRSIMRTDFVSASEELDQEQLAKLFSQEHLFAIPIVDGNGRMKGIVTADDIVNVVTEEASEDIQKIGGMEALDAPYLQVKLTEMVRKRGGWLAALFIGETLTATAMSYFEKELARAIVLGLFIPLIISSGGNSGSQATTLVIRAMALGEVTLRDWWRVVRREVAAGLTLGCMLGSIGMTRILVWQGVASATGKELYGQHYLLVAATVGASLVGVVLFGTIAGSMLPFALRRLGLDPASASAPFVATLVDVTGLIIYFTVASIILRGTLL
jgi:magnesium transporter